MPEFPPDMPLGDARNRLAKKARRGAECPCCTQEVKEYRRPIHSGIARALIEMYKAGGTDWIYKPDVLRGKGSASRDESIARYWGLIEEESKRRPDGGRAGYWRVTELGRDFVLGRVRIPKYAHIYNKECKKLSGELVSIRDCLGKKFDYRELMES